MKSVMKSFEDLSKIKSLKKPMQSEKKKRDNSFKNLTPVQERIFLETLRGLKYYSEEDLKTLPEHKKKTIANRFKKTQMVLNIWKQNIMINYTNFLLEKFNVSKNVINDLTESSKPSTNFICNMSFEDLNITRTDIINKLIKEKLLPLNFQEL